MGLWQNIALWFDLIVGSIKALRGDPDAWERSITKLEAQDKSSIAHKNPILFTGSSSITLWSSLEQDLAPLPVLNRGFGGAKIGDVSKYADRIIIPFQPRAIVLFAGTNDIAAPHPASAQEVFEGYLEFVNRIHAALPDTQVTYISITPTPSRWRYWPIANKANQLIAQYTESDPRLSFIDMTPHLLDDTGLPKRKLFRMDKLHPNKKGYEQWTAIIKPRLRADYS